MLPLTLKQLWTHLDSPLRRPASSDGYTRLALPFSLEPSRHHRTIWAVARPHHTLALPLTPTLPLTLTLTLIKT